MSASMTMVASRLEDDVAAVLGMRENAFRKQPGLFLVTQAYFKGDRPRILSAVAAGSGLIVLAALFVGFVSFSPFRAGSGNQLRIDLPSDHFIEPYAKAFMAGVPVEESRPRSRDAAVAKARRIDGDTLRQGTVRAPDKRRIVQGAGVSRSKIGQASRAGSLEKDGDGNSPDTEESMFQERDMSPDRLATSSDQAGGEASSVVNKALANRRSGIDALRALRHQ